MRTLVLNAGYEPMAVVSFRRALVLLMTGKATLLAADDEPVFSAEQGAFPRPSVILLRRYIRPPYHRTIPVSRRGVLRRDGGKCGYCGEPANTIDHILPKSRGGRDTWENLVACCVRCNNTKGNKTPQEMGWALRFHPTAPGGTTWMVRGADTRHPLWANYLAEAA